MDALRHGIVAWRAWRTPGAVLRSLRANGTDAIEEAWDGLSASSKAEVEALGEQLGDEGVRAWLYGSVGYPSALAKLPSPPPVLFGLGNADLLQRRAVGICGSRDASRQALDATRSLARTIAGMGDVLVAGNARGVDAEAQGSALAAGGHIITVIPEGLLRFRLQTGESDVEPSSDDFFAISQFPPWQPWSVGGAMARNELIIGLASALVVVEAGDRGGTLAAGEAALRMRRPVIALLYETSTPPGNATLLGKGARVASNPRQVYERIAEVAPLDVVPGEPVQMPLAF